MVEYMSAQFLSIHIVSENINYNYNVLLHVHVLLSFFLLISYLKTCIYVALKCV